MMKKEKARARFSALYVEALRRKVLGPEMKSMKSSRNCRLLAKRKALTS
jgi:hypothetical protein